MKSDLLTMVFQFTDHIIRRLFIIWTCWATIWLNKIEWFAQQLVLLRLAACTWCAKPTCTRYNMRTGHRWFDFKAVDLCTRHCHSNSIALCQGRFPHRSCNPRLALSQHGCTWKGVTQELGKPGQERQFFATQSDKLLDQKCLHSVCTYQLAKEGLCRVCTYRLAKKAFAVCYLVASKEGLCSVFT